MPADFAALSRSLDGPDWLRDRRRVAAAAFAAAGVPSSEAEVWRYSRIDELDLDAYEPAAVPGAADAVPPIDLGPVAARVVVANGHVVSADVGDPAVTVERAVDGVDDPGPEATPDDELALLNAALAPDPFQVLVARGAAVAHPIVVHHVLSGSGVLAAPRVVVRVGEGSQATVVEVFSSPADAVVLSLPVTLLHAARGARLAYASAQELGPAAWQIANQVSEVGQEASFGSVVAGLGGDYARLRSDCRLVGRGASGDLLAIYFGEGSQTLDFRTFQDHQAPDTTSNLLFKGAVGGSSRSVYTGLIKVRKQARGTNAFQTNRNIKLSEHAWAESVPNLEIENNDVRCSHASAVGPIDDDQRFYLESRGVPPRVADRLIVAGFFDEVITRVGVAALAQRLRDDIDAKLDRRGDS